MKKEPDQFPLIVIRRVRQPKLPAVLQRELARKVRESSNRITQSHNCSRMGVKLEKELRVQELSLLVVLRYVTRFLIASLRWWYHSVYSSLKCINTFITIYKLVFPNVFCRWPKERCWAAPEYLVDWWLGSFCNFKLCREYNRLTFFRRERNQWLISVSGRSSRLPWYHLLSSAVISVRFAVMLFFKLKIRMIWSQNRPIYFPGTFYRQFSPFHSFLQNNYHICSWHRQNNIENMEKSSVFVGSKGLESMLIIDALGKRKTILHQTILSIHSIAKVFVRIKKPWNLLFYPEHVI